jgi:hypothetical protein
MAFCFSVLLLLTVSGCVRGGASAELQQADALARAAIKEVRVNGLSGVHRYLAPRTAKLPQLATEIQKMRNALPADPDTVQLVGSEIEFAANLTLSKLRYLVLGRDRSAEAEVWVERRGDSRYVETLRISALP